MIRSCETTDLVLHPSASSRISQQLLANQSLKLTEGAVDDFAARQYAENDMIS
jgi:hypothetical protein